MDIDIYHTTEDRAVYNGGLFWQTDHYLTAATSTHRTYSKANAPAGRPYGGGPGCEHNYTTGLLYYYYLTGDTEASRAVKGLADWVIAMDDGRNNFLGLVDPGPTGFATRCGTFECQGLPGRGPAARLLNALLDACLLSDDPRYLDKAEELICRVIHPADDLQDNKLLDVEQNWSYTMFLNVLARYIDLKLERSDDDHMQRYARKSVALCRLDAGEREAVFRFPKSSNILRNLGRHRIFARRMLFDWPQVMRKSI